MSGYSALRARYCCIIGVWAEPGASSFIGTNCSRASMQLHLGLGLPADQAREGVEGHAPESGERPDVLAVEREVEEFREPSLDAEFLARDEAHELANGVVAAKRDERAEIAITEWPRRIAREATLEGAHHVARLLVRRLRARRKELAVLPRAGGAIAQGEYIGIARRLESVLYDELVDAVGFEAAKVLQHLVAPDAGGPHGEVAGNLATGRGPDAARVHLDHLLGNEYLD